ncbi:MAG: tRNA lysidine(34) synthetase TilS [Acidimicrobiia bacterium]
MAATRRLSELTRSATSRLRLPDGPLTVAFSGGADSAALAHLVGAVGRDVRLLHVHHGFEASDALAAAAGVMASQLDVPIENVAVELDRGPSPEDKARDARYAVFREVPGAVLTAHTRDDSVETMLINLIRGTGVDGITGIPAHRPPNVYRPLLEVTRSETREIAAVAGLAFLDDPMNERMELTRNRVRRQIVPLMRDINPQVEEAMSRLASHLGEDASYLDRLAGDVDLSGGLAVGFVTTMPPALANRVIRRWLVADGIPTSSDLLRRVWAVASGTSPRQDLEGGRVVTRRGAMLLLE